MGGLKDFDATVDNRVESDWIPLVQLLLAHGVQIADRECLEVGTGWHPVLPVCFSLAGTRLCHTIDRVAHMSEHLSFRMMRRIETHLPAIACAAQRPLEDVTRRYSDLMAAGSLQELKVEPSGGFACFGLAGVERADFIPQVSAQLAMDRLACAVHPPTVFDSRVPPITPLNRG